MASGSLSRRAIAVALPVFTITLATRSASSQVGTDDLAGRHMNLVQNAGKLREKIIPALDGSSKDLGFWTGGEGYRMLTDFSRESKMLSAAMLGNDVAAKDGKRLAQQTELLNSQLGSLRQARSDEKIRAALNATYRVIGLIEEIKVTY